MGRKGKAIIIVLAVLLVAETALLAYTFAVGQNDERPKIYGEVGAVEDRTIEYLLENCGVDQLPIEADVIPDAETALKIGSAILNAYFPEEYRKDSKWNYSVSYNDSKGVWLVEDARTDIERHPNEALMGVDFAGVILSKSDAKILALYTFV